MKLVCEMYPFEDFYTGDDSAPAPEVLVINVNARTAERILERIAVYEELKARDDTVSELRFMEHIFECYGAEKIEDFNEIVTGIRILPEGAEKGWKLSDIAIPEMRICEGEVSFRCLDDSSEVGFTSPLFPLAEFETLMCRCRDEFAA
jgi:hypothetical protein